MRKMPRLQRKFIIEIDERLDDALVSVHMEIPSAGQLIKIIEHARVSDVNGALEIIPEHVEHGRKNYPYTGATKLANGSGDVSTPRDTLDDLMKMFPPPA